ncbi:MAG: hypothetical protein ABIT20_14510 [Gemmatimonadaceae bacterium]
MRIMAVIVGFVLVVIVAFVLLTRPNAEQRKRNAETSARLREHVLSRAIFKEMPAHTGPGLRGVVYEWSVGNGVATLVAFDDGTTSIYLSGGGGFIGAGTREPVKRAAQLLRDEAGSVSQTFKPVTAFPLPPDGNSVFYILTDFATLSSGPVSNAEVERESHPLAALARRAQDVITEVRKAT